MEKTAVGLTASVVWMWEVFRTDPTPHWELVEAAEVSWGEAREPSISHAKGFPLDTIRGLNA